MSNQPIEHGRGCGGNYAEVLADGAGCAASMVGDEKQHLDVNRIELAAALVGRPGLGDLEPPHKGVDPDPERVDLPLPTASSFANNTLVGPS
jgi:hypothetical protein